MNHVPHRPLSAGPRAVAATMPHGVLPPPSTSFALRHALFGSNPRRLLRAGIIACAIWIVVFVLSIFLMPVQQRLVPKVTLEEREIAMVLEQLAAEPPPQLDQSRPAAEAVKVDRVYEDAMPEGLVNAPEVHEDPPPSRRLEDQRRMDPALGEAGRARAREATAELSRATAALDEALDGLSASMKNARDGAPEPARGRRARSLGGGREDAQLAGAGGTAAGTMSADLQRSGVRSSPVKVGALASAPADGGGGAESAAGGAAPGVYRSNSQLLVVIQKYAAGIQYCYGNELKRTPGISGKLVVAMTIAASGAVTEATVVQNTVGSERLAACALAQIRDWRFPPISEGVTSFQVPFVFTPPE